MVLPAEKRERYTVSDYMSWNDGKRWEIIGGQVWSMTPAPTTRHQRISRNLGTDLYSKLKDAPCEVFIAPVDVVLSEYDVVQPDVLIVCDKAKITEANIQGAPDVVLEILSPSTAGKDKREKLQLYERHGVQEYFLIYPEHRVVERFKLEENAKYGSPRIWVSGESVLLECVGVELAVDDIFSGAER